MLSNVIEATENNSDVQTIEVLSEVTSYFKELTDFVNQANVIINMTVIKTVIVCEKIECIYYHSDHHGRCSCGEFLSSVGTRKHRGCQQFKVSLSRYDCSLHKITPGILCMH